MSIEEIKDIKKLQQMLKSEMELRKYTYKCCQEAGEELAKNSFSWDGKEKNLVIQAMELNERFEAKEKECKSLKEQLDKELQWHKSADEIDMINHEYAYNLKAENEKLKAALKSIANRPCLNIKDCDGDCLPHCKWNAHKVAQEALKGLE